MDRMIYLMQNMSVACQPRTGGLFLPTWYKYLEGEIGPTNKCQLVTNMPDDIGLILLAVIEILLRVGGLVAVFFVINGGFKYITSQGEPEQTKSARQTLTNALIGLVLTLVATAIVTFIGKALG